MSTWLIAIHALNLLAPALVLGGGLALVELWWHRRRFHWGLCVWPLVTYVFAGACVLVLGAALWGQDGKTVTYGALVLVLATLAALRMPTQP